MILKENIRYHAILYLISPILGLIYGLRSKSFNYIRWSIFIFTVLYGSLFTVELLGGEMGVISGADGARHWDNVYAHYQYLDFKTWWEELIAILVLDPLPTTKQDPFIHILSYIVGGIFNAPGLFFTVFSVIYAYFFSGAIIKIIERIDWRSRYNKFYTVFFVILFGLIFNPSIMQTVRTWMGGWVLIYAVLYYHDTKKKKYLLLALLPVTIHIGYALLGLGIWIVLFSGFRNPKLYFIVFIFSIIFSNAVDQFGLSNYITQTEVGSSKFDAYYEDEVTSEKKSDGRINSNTTFYKDYEILGIHQNVYSAMVIFIFLILRKQGFGKFENMLFSYGLAEASLANFFTQLFAVHNRSWAIASFFILSLLIIFLSKQDLTKTKLAFLKIQMPLFIFSILLVPIVLFKLSEFLNFSSGFMLITPFISWINTDLGISIRDLIVLFL